MKTESETTSNTNDDAPRVETGGASRLDSEREPVAVANEVRGAQAAPNDHGDKADLCRRHADFDPPGADGEAGDKVVPSTEDEKHLADVIEGLSDLADVDLDDEDEGEGDSYVRTFTIHFPEEVGDEFGVANLTLPIRQVLEWMLTWAPEERMLLSGIRDEFYSGDQEEDHYFMMDPLCWFPPSSEVLATRRVARAARHEEREARRKIFEAKYSDEIDDVDDWGPLEAERASLLREEKERIKRSQALASEWERFVIEREGWGHDRAERETATRTSLNAREAALARESEDWFERMFHLEHRHRQQNGLS